MTGAIRDGHELTATGPGGVFDVRPFWRSCDGIRSTPYYVWLPSTVTDAEPHGFAVYERDDNPYHQWESDHKTRPDAELRAEYLAALPPPPTDTVAVTLTRLDWFQICDGLDCRREAWEATGRYLDGTGGHEGEIQECHKPGEAYDIAATYRRLAHTIREAV